MRVAFLNPADGDDPFFASMVAFMRRAAADLHIELAVIDCHRQASTMREKARALVASAEPPEYLLLVNEEGLAVEVLPAASARGIKVLILNEGLMVPDRQALGSPGERHTGWLGELMPDDRRAGFLLAQALFAAASEGGRRVPRRAGRLVACGLGGSFTSSSLLRINGLRQAVAEDGGVELCAVVPANWEKQRAADETAKLLDLHPELGVVWAASDQMALGAAEALAARGRVPGRDVVLGGIDWAPFAFEQVRRGTFVATVGGHFMDGAWALVLLHDYHRLPSRGPISEKSQLAVVTRENVDAYERLFAPGLATDFARFSRVLHPEQDAYRFSVDAVL
jgi:ABC-type sugar transport system substrate-binding protein